MSQFILPCLLSASLLVSVGAAPVSSPAPTSIVSSASVTAFSATASQGSVPAATSTKGVILLDWDSATRTASPSSTSASASKPSTSSTSALLFQPAAAPSVPSKTKASWALPPLFTNMDDFAITSYAAGQQNLAVLRGSPVTWTNETAPHAQSDESVAHPAGSERWDMGYNSLQILYPKGSINPGNKPQGGAEFYAQPLDLRSVTNTTLQYSVYFPHDFNFVKGGKLPGLYGGHKGCSGGNAAEDCFSTRMMWRDGGKGELYLYVPKDKQTPALCATPPQSVCDSQYGLSIGRGAWKFALGDWTTIRQDVWLNTPGLNDGGFNIWINGKLVITANDVLYRENAVSCTNSSSAAPVTVNNEDWLAMSVGSDSDSSSSARASSMPSVTSSVRASASSSTTTGLAVAAASMPSSYPSSETVSTISARPTFQTPMRRWMQRDDPEQAVEGDVDSASLNISGATPSISQSSRVTAVPSTSAPTTPSDDETPDDDDSTTMSQGQAPSDEYSVPDDIVDSLSSDDDVSDMAVSQSPSNMTSSGAESADDTVSAEAVAGCEVGFIGLFFSTFFGGHTAEWATPKDQYTYYKGFELWTN